MSARVLVVEDNPASLSLMEFLLRAFGYTVLTATDGLEGLELARLEQPDVILMDLQMPRLDGFETASRLRDDPALKGIPIVAVTAFAMVGDRNRILAHGFDGYIAKPIAPETFVDEVEVFIPSALHSSRPSVHGDTPPAARTSSSEDTDGDT